MSNGVLAAFTHILTPSLECIVQTIFYFILCLRVRVCLYEFNVFEKDATKRKQCLNLSKIIEE